MKTSEARIQYECVTWIRNHHPETYGLFFEINNNPNSQQQGGIRTSMGMFAGVSDTVFLWNGKTYWLEFKNATGRQQKVQKTWQKIVEGQGFEYHLIRSLEQFQKIISEIVL